MMRIKRVEIIRREDSYFHTEIKKIKAHYQGNGYVVMIFFESSPIDNDFGENVWVPKAEELQQIANSLDKSDHMTYEMLGHGWDGDRPYHRLEEFV